MFLACLASVFRRLDSAPDPVSGVGCCQSQLLPTAVEVLKLALLHVARVDDKPSGVISDVSPGLFDLLSAVIDTYLPSTTAAGTLYCMMVFV